jgi:predicted RNA-binding protein YlxR (DUF448 family)
MTKGGDPLRMCVSCRERSEQADLVRLNIKKDKVVVVEKPAHAFGRSVYLCPRDKCFDALVKKGHVTFKSTKYEKMTVPLNEYDAFQLRKEFRRAIRRIASRRRSKERV